MPRRTTGDAAGAELRQWLLEREQELCESILFPPPVPIDGRPPTKVNPDLEAALAAACAGWVGALAEGREYRLDRRSLPPQHPLRRQGDLGDALILGADNELRLAE